MAAAYLGTLYRGAAVGPSFVQALEVEQVFGEAGFQADEGSGGAPAHRLAAQNRPKSLRLVAIWLPATKKA